MRQMGERNKVIVQDKQRNKQTNHKQTQTINQTNKHTKDTEKQAKKKQTKTNQTPSFQNNALHTLVILKR
jgi:hypothetical protein